MKLVVAMEPRSYREAIGTFFREVRENLEVSVAEPVTLGEMVTSFNPDLVFSSDPKTPSTGRWPAWLEFHSGTYGQAVTLYLDGECSKIEDVDLGDLLSIVDRVERSLANSPRLRRH
ncbi:MAG: hypothetical protein M3R38_05085 [Actinomycetota bacterium]|nr:hypothetical protein [Actinomycetota bacterium]